MISAQQSDVDNLIERLLALGESQEHITTEIAEGELHALCTMAKDIFASQSVLIEVGAPVNVCGDIHGQYADLLRIFSNIGFPSGNNYLFLGDYVDRGRHSIETISLLFCYKIKYPQNFFLLRGNHETPTVNRIYGFRDECLHWYKSDELWKRFSDAFGSMPICALIGKRILCMHGGLSPELEDINQLKSLPRLVDPSSSSLVTDLLWSDPNPGKKGWSPNPRGISYSFGSDIVLQFCEKNSIDLIVRAHQVAQNGFDFFARRHLVTIFSAPNYNGQFNNSGASMFISASSVCSFAIYRPLRTSRHFLGH